MQVTVITTNIPIFFAKIELFSYTFAIFLNYIPLGSINKTDVTRLLINSWKYDIVNPSFTVKNEPHLKAIQFWDFHNLKQKYFHVHNLLVQ